MSEEFTPTSPIDEQTAWSLIRSLPRFSPGKPTDIRVFHDPRLDVWLQVQPTGEWEASTGLSAAARDLLELYLPLQLEDALTIAQIGQSLDGRIATDTGQSHYITGRADITRLHRLRALVDAVIIGAGTIAADDPRLTVREVQGENPIRVVLDPDDRLDRAHKVFQDGEAPTLHLCRAEKAAEARAVGRNCEVVALPVNENGGFEPGNVIAALRNRGLNRTLVEGGGITVSRFLQAGVLDRLHVTVAPLLIGSGRTALTLDPIESLDSALRPPFRRFQLGDDLLFDFDLRSRTDSAPHLRRDPASATGRASKGQHDATR